MAQPDPRHAYPYARNPRMHDGIHNCWRRLHYRGYPQARMGLTHLQAKIRKYRYIHHKTGSAP